ncbi:MAG TPA: hypothetical protein VKA05_06665, partial [Acidimicrobiales bacterium]|nr:hypothetical protein [Acidimicrobiales bacterium]
MAQQSCVATCTTVELPVGGRVVVASDLFLGTAPTPASISASRELSRTIAAITGPGAVVIAGNLFELTEGECVLPEKALAAHVELREALATFATDECRRVILLPGTRDRAICYDADTMASITCCGFEVALAAELAVRTASGVRLVRVEPGWAYDARCAYADPTDPHDTPLGHHAVADLFPALTSTKSGWLEG